MFWSPHLLFDFLADEEGRVRLTEAYARVCFSDFSSQRSGCRTELRTESEKVRLIFGLQEGYTSAVCQLATDV